MTVASPISPTLSPSVSFHAEPEIEPRETGNIGVVGTADGRVDGAVWMRTC